MSVTVVSCVYGEYVRFEAQWERAIAALDPAPDFVVVMEEWGECPWKHKQAFYLQEAVAAVDTDWFWIVDIDDLAMPDGLAGLHQVAADVWQLGFHRSDGETYIPPRITNDDYLASERNVYVGASMIRTEAFRSVGGFDDIALQDWGLWRKLARAGMTFEPSDRAHFHYTMHPDRRGETELTIDARAEHVAEMMEAERALA